MAQTHQGIKWSRIVAASAAAAGFASVAAASVIFGREAVKQPKSLIPEQPLDADVIVVGAGISGLAAATKLHRAGFKVVVLEASHHVGGRIRKVNELEFTSDGTGDFEAIPAHHGRWLNVHRGATDLEGSDGVPAFGHDAFNFHVGGEFVHGPKAEMAAEMKRKGIVYDKLYSWAHGDGGPSKAPSPWDGGIGYYFDGETKKLRTYDEHFKEHGRLIDVLWSMRERDSSVWANDRRSLYEYLADEGLSRTDLAFADAGYANTVAGTLHMISAGLTAMCERHWGAHDGDGDFRVSDNKTMYSFIEALAKDLPDIREHHKVTSVTLHEPKTSNERSYVTVDLQTPAQHHSSPLRMSARAIVVTCPVGVLQRGAIKFTPELPPRTIKALHSIKIEPAFKIFAKFAQRVWPADAHGTICANSFAPELWFECAPDAPATKTKGTTNEDGGPCYATAFFTSHFARNAAALKPETASELLREQLVEMFARGEDAAAIETKIRDGYRGGFSIDWSQVPNIYGGYTVFDISEMPDARVIMSSPHYAGKLAFAGEGVYDKSHNTANAAYASGLQAAGLVLDELQAHHHPLPVHASIHAPPNKEAARALHASLAR